MPSWLVSLLIPLAEQALNIGVAALEKKYPGVGDIIAKVVAILESGVKPPVINSALDGIGTPPNLVA